MSDLDPHNFKGDLAFASSVKDCRWHSLESPFSFERWHFDALSDDGREALVITFHDNYELSPRFFTQKTHSNGNSSQGRIRFPSVSLVYAVDGKPVLRAVNEFSPKGFVAKDRNIGCSIGNSSFELETAEYGSGFVLHIDILTVRKRRIKADLEWLSIESDLTAEENDSQTGPSYLNIAVPRSDVSGRISLTDKHGSIRRLVHFRGTGYHDHFQSSRPLIEVVRPSYWGRAHFADSTAIFHCRESSTDEMCTKLFLIKDGIIHIRDVRQKDEMLLRTRRGFKVPEQLSFISNDEIRLGIKPGKAFQRDFCESRMLSEMTLTLSDGKHRKAIGITELSTPEIMRSRFFRLLTDLRIGKDGKGPIY